MVQNLLATAAQALVQQTGLSASTFNSYKTAVTNALTEISSATTNVNGAAQSIASQKITIDQLQAQLNLKLAGSTQEDIDAQTAVMEQAQASMASIEAKIQKASLVSPITGTVTKQDAKVGQIATPGVVLVSIISDQGLEVDANIAEADIGKVKVGDPAVMTLDAFQGKTFSGKVSYVDPGETVIEGVPTYKTTFQFDNLGPDVKPGMTANIDVTTATHESAIYIPQRAVTTAADGTRTVRVYHGPNAPLEARRVTVGLRDENGNVEIVSGLNEGEIVVQSSG
jgi:HlyD family secretion protein